MRKGEKMSEEQKRKIGESNKGKKRTKEARKKMSEARKKNPVRYWLGKKRMDISGKNNWFYGKSFLENKSPSWKGDKVGYYGLHSWVRKKLGQPTKCRHCDKDGLKGLKIHWANKSHEYKRDLNDWLRLCVSCHKKYDNRTKEKNEKRKNQKKICT